MSFLRRLADVSGLSSGSYDATEDKGRRRPRRTRVKSEDSIATERKRNILSATTQDLSRNFAVAAWAIRKHLDFVSRFKFQSKLDDDGFNDALEAAIKNASKRFNFDASRRHSLRSATRLAETCRVKEGDVGWLKLRSGRDRGHIQAIESSRIYMPRNANLQSPEDWVNGVRVNPATGESLEYGICDRDIRTGRLTLRRRVPARNMLLHAFYERYDQVRGVSPVAAGLNWFQDTYEGFEYAQAKMKVGQLFGLVVKQDSDVGLFPNRTSATIDADGDGVDDSAHEVDLSSGIFNLDLDPGEDAQILESKNPSTETTSFLKLMIHVALKSLDIPYSFFDESFTNFYGSRGGLIQYLKSCQDKIESLQQFLDEWTMWRIGLLVNDGEISLPSGVSFSDLRWSWVPDGIPWWDPVKEVRGQSMAVAAGFDNPYNVCNTVGTSFEENIKMTAKAQRFAESHGVPLVYADSTAFRPEVAIEGADHER